MIAFPRLAVTAFFSAALIGGSMASAAPVVARNPVFRALPPRSNVMFDENGVLIARPHIMRTRFAPRPMAATLPYNGGPIQKVPKIYVTFWGPAWSTDPSGEAAYLQAYLNGIGGSAWLNSVTQYYDNLHGNITNPAGQLISTWSDTSAAPTHPTQSQIGGEGIKSSKHFGYSADAVYIIATAHNHNSNGFGSQFCAYHGSANSSNGPVAYTDLPYITDAGSTCGQNSVNPGAGGLLDGVSIVSGHEVAETQTDPIPPTGWSGSGGENGDLCAWQVWPT
jgi:serine protease